MRQAIIPYNGASEDGELINYVLTIYLVICKTAQFKCQTMSTKHWTSGHQFYSFSKSWALIVEKFFSFQGVADRIF